MTAAAYWGWLCFLATWWTAAAWTNRATVHGALGHRIGYLLGFGLGFTLLFGMPPIALGRHAVLLGPEALFPIGWRSGLWQNTPWAAALLFSLEILAFVFAWWARLHLGKLWSGMLTLREGHRVIDTGPYAIVRHPIYTGFITASWALALNLAGAPNLLGALVLTIVMAVKSGTEERLLARELGPESYAAYRRRVPMLVPFL